MTASNNRSNAELSILKECYKLAAEYEKNTSVRDILRSKEMQISLSDENIPEENDTRGS